MATPAKALADLIHLVPGADSRAYLEAVRADMRREGYDVDLASSGAALETTVVRRHVLLRIQHHDRASLLAGKLHAILQRPYPKGRDFYDLIWYLSDRAWPPPNLVLLNNALGQTGWTSAPLSQDPPVGPG